MTALFHLVLAAIIALGMTAPASAATLAVDCLSLQEALEVAQGGDTIRLEGDCPGITIRQEYPRRVTIDAENASVAGLQILGSNITWRGGTLTASGGEYGIAREGYAVYVEGRDISIAYVFLTGARNGIVVAKSRNVDIYHNLFARLRNDGINASETTNLTVRFNTFADPRSTPNTCDGVPTDLAMRHCAGVWKGGDHAGALQLRNAVVNARISYNFVIGAWGGGLSQNDLKGVDAPIRNVVIEGNRVFAATYSPIQLQANCIGCRIERNVVRNGRPDWKATIKYGAAIHCGNEVEAGPVDSSC